MTSARSKIASVVLTVIATLAFSASAFATPLEIEAGYEYAEISGIRGYKTRHLREKITSDRSVPAIGVRFHFARSFNVGLSYRHFKNIVSKGASGTHDVFDESEVDLQVFTPFSASEDIRELTLDARYAINLTDDLSLQLGPVLSTYRSVAKFTSYSFGFGQPLRTFSEYDARLGATAVLSYRIHAAWSVHASYRYATPPSRELHIFGAGVGYRF